MRLLLLLPLLLLIGCNEVNDSNLTLKCKYNPEAPFEDTFKLLKDGSVVWSSTNKVSSLGKNLKYKMDGDKYVLIGEKTFIDINKEKTVTPNSELYIIEKVNGLRSYDIFYAEYYATDPTRLFTCTA